MKSKTTKKSKKKQNNFLRNTHDTVVIGLGALIGGVVAGPIGALVLGGAFCCSKIFGWDGGTVWHHLKG